MVIPACLVDTNVLLRITRRADPEHSVAFAAVAHLAESGTRLYYTHQNIAELWNAMTRPISRNGLGLTPAEAETEVARIESGMNFLPEGEAVYREWRRLIVLHHVLGVQVHDARLAAAVMAHGVQRILTFNAVDSKRFTGVITIHPHEVPAVI